MKSKFVPRFLIILIFYSILFNWNVMGAPFGNNHASKLEPTRRKPDIIAGKDFLSLFMAAATSSKHINRPETISITPPADTTNLYDAEVGDVITVTMIYEDQLNATSTQKSYTSHQDDNNDLITEESEQQKTVIRDSRSSSVYSFNYRDKNTEIYEENEHPYYPSLPDTDIAVNSSSPVQVLSIRVSSSVGQSPPPSSTRSIINPSERIDTSTRSQFTQENLYVAEQENDGTHHAAAASKSILNIDEMEPMTIDSNHPVRETQSQLGANPDYLEQQRYKQLQKLNPAQHPYHHSVVYHGQNKDGNRARSVSYSSVIQNIQQPADAERNWEQAESIERPTYLQNSQTVIDKDYNRESFVTSSTPPPYRHWSPRRVQNKELIGNYQETVSTSTLPIMYQQPEMQWGQPETNQEYVEHKDATNSQKVDRTSTTPQIYQQQEIQWGQPEVNYEESYRQPTQTPKYIPPVYATEEQNYEVDESVSVMTNGRTHGIQQRPPAPQPVIPLQQPAQPETVQQQSQGESVPSAEKTDNNHKVGYVVEGRNFRKYRVEERTSDGFVVGEYGVVNHDDGSLRGVRYTADGTINPRLIYDALMKFLSL